MSRSPVSRPMSSSTRTSSGCGGEVLAERDHGLRLHRAALVQPLLGVEHAGELGQRRAGGLVAAAVEDDADGARRRRARSAARRCGRSSGRAGPGRRSGAGPRGSRRRSRHHAARSRRARAREQGERGGGGRELDARRDARGGERARAARASGASGRACAGCCRVGAPGPGQAHRNAHQNSRLRSPNRRAVTSDAARRDAARRASRGPRAGAGRAARAPRRPPPRPPRASRWPGRWRLPPRRAPVPSWTPSLDGRPRAGRRSSRRLVACSSGPALGPIFACRHVRFPLRQAPGHPRRPPLAREADRGRSRPRHARDPPRAARGRRQLQGRHGSSLPCASAPSAPRCWTSLTPGQQVVKIVDEELTELLGSDRRRS